MKLGGNLQMIKRKKEQASDALLTPDLKIRTKESLEENEDTEDKDSNKKKRQDNLRTRRVLNYLKDNPSI